MAGLLTLAVTAPGQAATPMQSPDVALHVQHLQAAGTRFAYAELGAGRTLILLNGTGSPMNEWDPQLLGALARSHRVLVFDYPGLGRSGRAPVRWDFSAAADWTAALIRGVSDGPVDVLGWSMGGFIAQQLAVRHPELVRRLVLASTNPGGRRATLGPAWVQQADSDPAGSDDAFLRTNFPRMPAAQARGRAFLSRLEAAIDSGAYPAETVPASTYRAMVQAEDPWLRSDGNSRALASLALPTLVITGRRDVITPPRNSRVLAELIPGAQLQLVAGAGHAFLFQLPDHAAAAISAFLLQA